MPNWAAWALFLLAGVVVVLLARRLDRRERRIDEALERRKAQQQAGPNDSDRESRVESSRS